MKDLETIINQILSYSNCKIHPPIGLPAPGSHELPGDVRLFYERCGELILFEGEDYSCQIVSPLEFVLSNPVIVGELVEEDISSHWYIIGHDGNDDYISIDLHPDRLGRCYDSFWDRHGLVGDCPVIAESFTDLLHRLVQNNGERWYWLREDFESLGDAYDDVEMNSD
ncbi:Antitoxin YokJ [compost metagenome]